MLGIPCAVGEDEQALPELPEVETVRRGAEPHLVGRRLRTLELRRDDLRWPMPKKALQGLVGRKCTSVKRRSKYLLVQFDGPKAPTALIHLGMTGNLIVDPIGPRAMRPEYRKHEHWRMDFGDRLMRFIDPRRFGALDVAEFDALAEHPRLKDLGQEPLEPAFDGAFLHRITRNRKVAIKQLLMNGHLLVGVGNIYASEALFGARIRPTTPAGRISRPRMVRLVAEIKAVLQRSIDHGGTTINDYLGSGEGGYFQQELTVYGRAGEGCLVCDKPITNKVLSGRSTFYCTTCQH